MPVINIKSLPFSGVKNIPGIIKNISRQFSDAMNIDEKNITVSWEFFEKRHVCFNGKTKEFQGKNEPPVNVYFETPDFNNLQTIEKMLNCIARGINEHAGISLNTIFITHHYARPSRVFDEGKIVSW